MWSKDVQAHKEAKNNIYLFSNGEHMSSPIIDTGCFNMTICIYITTLHIYHPLKNEILQI